MAGAENQQRHVRGVIVGSGVAGPGAAVKLQESGYTDFLVIERGNDVGGTWRDNTYPGAACDVPSQLYSFSFAPNPEWSRSLSPQPEIHAYLERPARESGVLDRFRFGVTAQDLSYDEDAWVWTAVTDAGTVVAGGGATGSRGLPGPRLPDVEGIDSFTGEIFHSARW